MTIYDARVKRWFRPTLRLRVQHPNTNF